MDNKAFLHRPHASSLASNFTIGTRAPPVTFAASIPSNLTTLSSHPLQSHKAYSDSIVVAQPTVNKLLSEATKQERFENNLSQVTNRTKTKLTHLPLPTVVTAVHLNPRETLNGLSVIPMTNTSSHLMAALNPAHLSDGAGSYFVSGLTDMASSYKTNPSSNTDIPSPSSSSNSSNPPSSSHQHHHHPHHQTRRHGEGGDPTRKRQMRLQKNREAARECRRKKKEYIKCLEERVAGLEAQNKALIEELRQLKELYCQREDTGNKPNAKSNTSTAR